MQRLPNMPVRQVPHDPHEDARDVARALAKAEAFERSRRERKKVEMRFAHMKRIFRLDRLRLRGLSGAKDEVLLTATAQNLRRRDGYWRTPSDVLTADEKSTKTQKATSNEKVTEFCNTIGGIADIGRS